MYLFQNLNTFISIHDLCCLSPGSVDLYTRAIFHLCAIKSWKEKSFSKNIMKKIGIFLPPPPFYTNFAFYIFNGFGSATIKKRIAKQVYSLVKQQQCMYVTVYCTRCWDRQTFTTIVIEDYNSTYPISSMIGVRPVLWVMTTARGGAG